MTAATSVSLTIDHLVLETAGPVDGFALMLSLQAELGDIVRERGLPASWNRDVRLEAVRLDGFSWDGRGGERALAGELARSIYMDAIR